jgi:hypothetical protein
VKSQRAISALRLLRLHSDGRSQAFPGVRREHQLSGFFRRLGGRRQRPSREATERTFLVAGVAGITQVFAAVRLSDSMNWGAGSESVQTQ